MEQNDRMELAPKEEIFASHNGFKFGYKPGLANGWIELRDKDDQIIGHIDGVASIYLARHSRS
jgi:hypothetical protein